MKTIYQCPECKRPLASRHHKQCQYCGAGIPQNLLYTREEVEEQNRESMEGQKERKAREKTADEIEKAKRKAAHRGIATGMIIGQSLRK